MSSQIARIYSVAQDAPASKTGEMSIHQRIRQLRKQAGLSQAELADAVSRAQPDAAAITRQTVQHWEREGGTAPKRTRLDAVAKVLGSTVESLLYDEPLTTPAQVLQYSTATPSEPVAAAETTPTPWMQLPQAVDQVVSAVAALSPSAWAMVRGALDSVVGHPEMRDDVAGNVLLVLQATSGKRRLAA